LNLPARRDIPEFITCASLRDGLGYIGTHTQFEPARLNQLINNSAEQHCLAFARIALDPEELTLCMILLSLKIDIVEDPAVGVFEYTALILLDLLLIVAGVRRLQFLETGLVLSIRYTLYRLSCFYIV
jgi:hypothetical protein